jgi:hypothetical protein
MVANRMASRPAVTTPGVLRGFVRSLIVHIGAVGIVMVGAAMLSLSTISDHGWLATIGGWFLLMICAVLGLAGGGITGALYTANRVLEAWQDALLERIHSLPSFGQDIDGGTIPVGDIRIRYQAVLDRLLEDTLGRLALPGWLDRILRRTIRDAIVGDFIASCEKRGITMVPPQEFRNWLLGKGAVVALYPVYDILSTWRYLIFGILGLVAVSSILLAYVTS